MAEIELKILVQHLSLNFENFNLNKSKKNLIKKIIESEPEQKNSKLSQSCLVHTQQMFILSNSPFLSLQQKKLKKYSFDSATVRTLSIFFSLHSSRFPCFRYDFLAVCAQMFNNS
jgi:hypothetical protein